jgi:hypothetical protein
MSVRLYVGATVMAIVVAVAPAAAQERLVHQEVDRNTNAVVRVFKTTDGGRIEVATPRLKVTKSVVGQRVVTRMTEGAEQLVISLDRDTLAVTSAAGRVTAPRGDREKLERGRQLISGSAVGRHAAALIGQMGFGSGTPVQPMLLTTRAFILAAAGDDGGNRELSRWAKEAKARSSSVARVKVIWRDEEQDSVGKGMTPSDCWDAYAKEAIAAYMEYEECMKDQSWWNIAGQMGCATIYDMRAIGAFSWWLKCVALN